MSGNWFNPQRIPEGQPAPDFTLQSTAGEFNLYRELKSGPVMILFYMGDFGTTCTYTLNKLAEITPVLEGIGVRVFAISVNSMNIHTRFQARMDFPFHLLSDVEGKVSKDYGCIIENHILYAGMAGRAVYVINAQGIIVYSWIPEENPAMSPNFPALVQKVKDLF